MAITIGIDLGTTNSVVAYVDQHGKPVAITNEVGQTTTPSVIAFRDNELLVGEEAKELQAMDICPIAAYFKRQMGDPLFALYANEREYSAIELSAILLRQLKQSAQNALGDEVKDVVITVPAYFKDPERKATIEAGRQAGLNVLKVVNEPTAAAVAYGNAGVDKEKNIVVYDLGGGTFDVTILHFQRGEITVRTSVGDHQLGGKDWDERIVEYVASAFKDEFGSDPLEHAESMADLLVLAEEAKKKLSALEVAQLVFNHDGDRGKYEISRSELDTISADLMQRTIAMVERALEDVDMVAADIDEIVLVGGSTRMPMVERFVEQYFGKKAVKGVNVDEAVALGAALLAAEYQARNDSAALMKLGGLPKTRDVTNHSLGMIATNQDMSAYINTIILAKDKIIPCHEARPYQFKTAKNRNNQLEIYVTQGESEYPGDVSYLGRYLINNIPHRGDGNCLLDVNYQYDESGTVNVSATEKSTGSSLSVEVAALPLDIPERFLGAPVISQAKSEFLTAYLAFDLSGSMSGRPLAEAKKAALGFLQNTDLNHAAIGVIAFSDRVETTLVACQNAKKIEKAINKLESCQTGVGNLGQPFDELFDLLNSIKDRKFGIVLADGVWCRQDYAVKQAKRCHQQEIDIIAIGFGGADKQFLADIASTSEASFFTSVEGLVETFSTIAQVLTESQAGIDDTQSNNRSFLAGLRRKL